MDNFKFLTRDNVPRKFCRKIQVRFRASFIKIGFSCSWSLISIAIKLEVLVLLTMNKFHLFYKLYLHSIPNWVKFYLKNDHVFWGIINWILITNLQINVGCSRYPGACTFMCADCRCWILVFVRGQVLVLHHRPTGWWK